MQLIMVNRVDGCKIKQASKFLNIDGDHDDVSDDPYNLVNVTSSL